MLTEDEKTGLPSKQTRRDSDSEKKQKAQTVKLTGGKPTPSQARGIAFRQPEKKESEGLGATFE